jgi:hypothetical protein
MKRMQSLVFLSLLLLLVPASIHAQAWTGILKPTYGTGACTPEGNNAGCAIDWSNVGIPGGVPSSSWTQSGSTILAATYGNGSTDAHSGIQTALNACGTNQYVLLGSGTFLLTGTLSVPSNCALRGAGANLTILQNNVGGSDTSGTIGIINMGHIPSTSADVSVSGGATAGSNSLTLSTTSGMSVGGMLFISELNDTFVNNVGGNGTCGWCDDFYGGARSLGQMAMITAINGSTVTINPSLYRAMALTPLVKYFPVQCQYCGVEDLQIVANNTGVHSAICMDYAVYSWVKGVEFNYTDADYIDVNFGLWDEIINNYASNSYEHGPGSFDNNINLRSRTTATLVQNNIIERTHDAYMIEWGAAGNVNAYNYMFGNFSSATVYLMGSSASFHGAHPQFNLDEGNIGSLYAEDDTWGSASDQTIFRSWYLDADLITNPTCDPVRGTVVSTPVGVQTNGSCSSGTEAINGWWATQQMWGISVDHLQTDQNVIGAVVGSSEQVNTPATSANALIYCSASCPNRPYGNAAYSLSFGYSGSSSGSGSAAPYATALVHEVYTYPNNSTIAFSGLPTTLPNSFYLSAQPPWWVFPSGTASPWPAIGPDVSGGLSDANGYAYMNPAMNCYVNVMGGGKFNPAGTPLTFNEASCYGSGSGGSPPAPPAPPPATRPAPPTGLSAIVN